MLCPQKGRVGLEVPLKTVKNFLMGKALGPGVDPVAQVEGVRTRRCAGDQGNPRGRCCLATLKAEVARLA